MVIIKQTSGQLNVFEHLLALVVFQDETILHGQILLSMSMTETRIPVMLQSFVIVIATQVYLFHCHGDENTNAGHCFLFSGVKTSPASSCSIHV